MTRPPAEAPRHGRLRRRHPVRFVGKALLAAVAVIVVSGVSIGAIAVWDVARSVSPGVHLSHIAEKPDPRGDAPQVGAVKGAVDLLVIGTDTRTDQGQQFQDPEDLAASSGAGNNDVNILVHIPVDHSSATVISFPRDLILPIPACPGKSGKNTYGSSDQAMLNTALERGGLRCPVLTIEELTGLKIGYAAEVDFRGVAAMSNAVGGVKVCLATPIKDDLTNPPLDLTAGEHTIVGPEALSFLRTRHGVGDGSDLGRISNQQVFLSALARKVKTGGVLANPLELYPLAKAATSSLLAHSDTLSDPTSLVQIALALKDVDLSKVAFVQYPVQDDPDDPNRVIPIDSAAATLNQALVSGRSVEITGTTGIGAQAAATPDPSSSTPSPASTPAPGSASPAPSTAAPAAPVQLPPSILGQSASEQTCSKGN